MEHKTILVTGGAGFVGSNLIARLVQEEHRVISVDNYFAGSRERHVPGAEYREGHTKDIATLVPEEVDLIFHLGEYSRVEQSVLEPEVVHDLNVVGTAAVVEFWKARGCKLVYAGSSTKFGDGGETRQTSPYAMTKAANSELVRAVGEAEGLPYAIPYFYNVYGPGERTGVYGTLIESFKHMYLRGTPLTVVSPGTQRRNFTHVDDIVDGLMRIAERGHGDEFGLGNAESFSVLETAQLFGNDIVLLPERTGNRMQSALDTSKSEALGWKATRTLREYVRAFVAANPRGAKLERRVLVFSTTFHPVHGPAEDALCELMRAMPDVQFDIITAAFAPDAHAAECPVKNATIYRVGRGRPSDKYLLPFAGLRIARRLHREHRYLFAWALMASYAALAGVALKRTTRLPLLITLADHDLARVALWKRAALRLALTDADQVYGGDAQESHAAHVSGRSTLRRSIGDGDAFANTLRFAYSSFLAKLLTARTATDSRSR